MEKVDLRHRSRKNPGSKAKKSSLIYSALVYCNNKSINEFSTRNEIMINHYGFTRPGLCTAVMSDLVYGGFLKSSRYGYQITFKGYKLMEDIQKRS